MSPVQAFASKDQARRYVSDCLARMHAARFPFPPQGRIPNFAGAREAAARLLAHPLLMAATRIKVNPDAPQHRRICAYTAPARGFQEA